MKSDYSKLQEKDYQELYEKYEASQKEVKHLKTIENLLVETNINLNKVLEDNKDLRELNKQLNETINKQNDHIQKLLDEIQRLRNNMLNCK